MQLTLLKLSMCVVTYSEGLLWEYKCNLILYILSDLTNVKISMILFTS